MPTFSLSCTHGQEHRLSLGCSINSTIPILNPRPYQPHQSHLHPFRESQSSHSLFQQQQASFELGELPKTIKMCQLHSISFICDNCRRLCFYTSRMDSCSNFVPGGDASEDRECLQEPNDETTYVPNTHCERICHRSQSNVVSGDWGSGVGEIGSS